MSCLPGLEAAKPIHLPKEFKQLTEEGSLSKATETFAQNLAQMKLKKGYMSDTVRPDNDEGRFFVGLNGLSSTIYGMFCRQLSENGWNISSRDVNTPRGIPSGVISLLTFYR